MSSIESRIDEFIAFHNIDPDMKDDISEMITGCMSDLFKQVFSQPVPESATKAKKVLKSEKVEDPATCEALEDLRNCTTGVLNQFCKGHNLKVGGNKKELMDRVWRHLQGESSDEDQGRKPKAGKKVPEKHACYGTNAAGAPCGLSGSEEFGCHHFCFRHITDAQKFLVAPEPVAKPAKVSKAKVAKPAEPVKQLAPLKKRANFVPKVPEPELESESDQQETDDEN